VNSSQIQILEHASGVKLLVDSDPRFYSCSLAVALLGGCREETEHQHGVTHLLEHLLFKRTSSKGPLAIAEQLDTLGGDINAVTDSDSICLFGTVPAKSANELLTLFFEFVLDAQFTQQDLELERDVIRTELQEADDDPIDFLYRSFSTEFWKGSSLAHPVFGYLQDLEKFSLGALQERLRRLRVSSRILVAAVGPYTAEALAKMLPTELTSLEKGARPVHDSPACTSGLRRFEAAFGQTYVLLGHESPSVHDEYYLAAEVASMALGGCLSSRLYRRLREEAGLVYDVASELDTYEEVGSLLISTNSELEQMPRVLELLEAELQQFVERGIKQAEFERVRQALRSQLIIDDDSASSRLWRLIESEILFKEYVSTESVLERIDGLTLVDVNRVIEPLSKPNSWMLALGGTGANELQLPVFLERLVGG